MKIDQLSSILNQELGVHGNNCKTVIDFTFALHRSRTVNLSQMANYSSRTDEISTCSIYKNYQRLVHNCKISQDDLATCILKMLDINDCKLTLALDRTNWMYGKQYINFLVLSVCVLGCAIPIYWTELDGRGNSNTEQRKELLARFVSELGADRIDYLLADREFIGEDWFKYLIDTGINFVIRVKSNIWLDVDGKQIKSGKLFKQVSQGGVLSHKVKINGLLLQMQATRSTENNLVIVISNKLSEPNLFVIYAKRWRIECLFANLKSKGFNFEDTHFTAKDRIGNLTKLIVLALTICYLVGLVRASYQPIMVKTHGYKQNSFFRYGYDLLIQKLNNNLHYAIKLISLCMSYLPMEVKCKKLISVM
jgi:hypothetical protein